MRSQSYCCIMTTLTLPSSTLPVSSAQARAHWGKLHMLQPVDVRRLYGTRLAAFQALREGVDPERKFSNTWLDRMVLDA